MTYSYVIDTFTWVEYLIGSAKGEKVKQYIESGRAATPSIALCELKKWFLREIEAGRRTLEDMSKAFEFAEAVTQIIDLDAPLAKKAGETDFMMKKQIKGWPLTDSIIYTVAREEDALIITGDRHFKDLSNVVFVE